MLSSLRFQELQTEVQRETSARPEGEATDFTSPAPGIDLRFIAGVMGVIP